MTISSINVYTPARPTSTSLNRKWATKAELVQANEQIKDLKDEIKELRYAIQLERMPLDEMPLEQSNILASTNTGIGT
jgi:hypothetical protein